MNRLADALIKQDRLPANKPYSGFYDIHDHEARLYPLGGYRPLSLRVKRNSANKDATVLLLEKADPANFVREGVTFEAYETEGAGGKITFYDLVQRRSVVVRGGLQWFATGLNLIGDPNVLPGGNKLAFGQNTGEVFVTVYSASGILIAPLLRLRRVYDTPVIGAVIGVGDGVTSEFVFTAPAAQTPICPSSVKINYNALTDVIRDDGAGKLVCIPPDVRLGGKTDVVDYAKGIIKVSFASTYIPAGGNITVDYEYASDNLVENSDYSIEWQLAG